MLCMLNTMTGRPAPANACECVKGTLLLGGKAFAQELASCDMVAFELCMLMIYVTHVPVNACTQADILGASC